MEMPSLDKISQMIVDGVMEPRLTTMGLYGNPESKAPKINGVCSMMHQWGWTEKELEWLLTKCGFHEIEFVRPVYHIEKRDLRVECRRKE